MNYDNLKILADYLESLPEDYKEFDMSDYYRGSNTYDYMGGEEGCGTVACAAGHGPAAGLTLTSEQLDFVRNQSRYSRWGEYVKLIFGLEFDDGIDLRAEWLFSGAWTDIDNSINGAAARIHYLLENHCVPQGFSLYEKDEWQFFISEYEPYWKGT